MQKVQVLTAKQNAPKIRPGPHASHIAPLGIASFSGDPVAFFAKLNDGCFGGKKLPWFTARAFANPKQCIVRILAISNVVNLKHDFHSDPTNVSGVLTSHGSDQQSTVVLRISALRAEANQARGQHGEVYAHLPRLHHQAMVNELIEHLPPSFHGKIAFT